MAYNRPIHKITTAFLVLLKLGNLLCTGRFDKKLARGGGIIDAADILTSGQEDSCDTIAGVYVEDRHSTRCSPGVYHFFCFKYILGRYLHKFITGKRDSYFKVSQFSKLTFCLLSIYT